MVVGGQHSNNTRELAARCRERGKPALHVQSAADLDAAWFKGFATVGLTAGTSTLPETIDEVHRALVRIGVDSGFEIPDSGFEIPDSGFEIRNPGSPNSISS